MNACCCAGQPQKLGARAFDLLLVLIEERHRVVPKTELLDRVWPRLVVEENNLQVQVMILRRLLGSHAIGTVPGRGYRFTAPLRDAPPLEAARSPEAASPQPVANDRRVA
jgi:DNA-binding winged helix-turn-helix (wHTH) protein